MYGAQYAVARVGVVYDDAKSEDIGDLRKRLVLGAHLVIDAVEVFLSSEDIGHDVLRGKCLFDRGLDLGNHFLSVSPGLPDRFFDHV